MKLAWPAPVSQALPSGLNLVWACHSLCAAEKNKIEAPPKPVYNPRHLTQLSAVWLINFLKLFSLGYQLQGRYLNPLC